MLSHRTPLRVSIVGAALLLSIAACAAPQAATPSLPPTNTEVIKPTIVTFTPAPLPTATAVPPSPTPVPATTAPTQPPSPCAALTVDPASVALGTPVLYCDKTSGFSFTYPSAGIAAQQQDSATRLQLPFNLGTNLHEKYLDVNVAPGSGDCSTPLAQGYAPGTVPTENVTFNGIVFKKETGSDAGAGNYYEWEAYSTVRGPLCISLSFVLHWVNAQNYSTPPPEFDQVAESAVFQTIMASFAWLSP